MQYPLPIDMPDELPFNDPPRIEYMAYLMTGLGIYVCGLFFWRWRNERHDKSP